MNKEERTKTLINNIKLNINEQNVYEFGLCVEQWKQILDYIGELQQENKQLKEQIEKYEHYCKTTGIEELMKENKKYKEVVDKAIKFIEYNNEILYTYEPDYDYEENIVDNYDISNYREDLLKILRGEING